LAKTPTIGSVGELLDRVRHAEKSLMDDLRAGREDVFLRQLDGLSL
jgi:hypothetical protein